MKPHYDKKIVLTDGTQLFGCGFGKNRQVIAEIVFNTSIMLPT